MNKQELKLICQTGKLAAMESEAYEYTTRAFNDTDKIRAYFDGFKQERHNSITNALELRLSCTNPSIYHCGISCREVRMDGCAFGTDT